MHDEYIFVPLHLMEVNVPNFLYMLFTRKRSLCKYNIQILERILHTPNVLCSMIHVLLS